MPTLPNQRPVAARSRSTMANSSRQSGASSGRGSWERMELAMVLFPGQKASRTER